MNQSVTNADRAGLANAVVSISLNRRDLAPLLPSIQAPTLFVTVGPLERPVEFVQLVREFWRSLAVTASPGSVKR